MDYAALMRKLVQVSPDHFGWAIARTNGQIVGEKFLAHFKDMAFILDVSSEEEDVYLRDSEEAMLLVAMMRSASAKGCRILIWEEEKGLATIYKARIWEPNAKTTHNDERVGRSQVQAVASAYISCFSE